MAMCPNLASVVLYNPSQQVFRAFIGGDGIADQIGRVHSKLNKLVLEGADSFYAPKTGIATFYWPQLSSSASIVITSFLN